MDEARTRIGRVRMKNGGADVRVLHQQPANGEEDWRGSILKNARAVSEQATDDAPLVGYVLVGIYADGCTSVGYRYDSKTCPIPRTLLPAWLAETVRRDLLINEEARDVFNEMFEWKET